jgi:hypothetical protein
MLLYMRSSLILTILVLFTLFIDIVPLTNVTVRHMGP